MKITIEYDDGMTIEHRSVCDYYLAVRKMEPRSQGDELAVLPETTSVSYGPNLREIAKEIAQSLYEIQDFLKKQRGNS